MTNESSYPTDMPDNNETSDLEAHLEKYGGWTDLGGSESETSLLTPAKVTISDTNLQGKSVKVQYTESGERFWVDVALHDVETGRVYGLVANKLQETPLDTWHPICFHVFHVWEAQSFEDVGKAEEGEQTWEWVPSSHPPHEDFVVEGSHYTGDKNDEGLPHGQGAYNDPAGWRYEGTWKDGQRHGKGTMTSIEQVEELDAYMKPKILYLLASSIKFINPTKLEFIYAKGFSILYLTPA